MIDMRKEQKLTQTKISSFVMSDSGKTAGKGDTKLQMAAGRASTMVSASNTTIFENSTGQTSSNVQPGMCDSALGRSDQA